MAMGRSFHPNEKVQQAVGSSAGIGAGIGGLPVNPYPAPPSKEDQDRFRRERILEMVIRSVGPGTDVIATARAAMDFIEKG
jgi:hypothetical protein